MGQPVLTAFRATPEQRQRYERAAALDGRTLSSWLRIVANRAADAALESKRKKRAK